MWSARYRNTSTQLPWTTRHRRKRRNPGEGFSELEVSVSGQLCADCMGLNQLFSTRRDFTPGGHLAVSGDKFCHTVGRGCCWQAAEAGILQCTGQARPQLELLVTNVQGTKPCKPWFKWTNISCKKKNHSLKALCSISTRCSWSDKLFLPDLPSSWNVNTRKEQSGIFFSTIHFFLSQLKEKLSKEARRIQGLHFPPSWFYQKQENRNRTPVFLLWM